MCPFYVCLCMRVLMYMHVPCVCRCVKIRRQPCCFVSGTIHRISGDRVSYWPEAYQLGHSDWPVSPSHPPISTSPGLGLQVCATTSSLYHHRT